MFVTIFINFGLIEKIMIMLKLVNISHTIISIILCIKKQLYFKYFFLFIRFLIIVIYRIVL